MDLDLDGMVNEVKKKRILHWNYRGLTEIPNEVRCACTNVQEMYLKCNQLLRLPFWISDFSNLTNLYLYGNSIEELPDSLRHMNKLTVLDLSVNKLKQLPTCLGHLKNLRSLILNQNFISSLPKSLSQLDKLECLFLSGNQIVALPEWLGSLPILKELFVDNNLLEEIPNRLTLSNSLSIISVCSNKLSYLPLNAFISSPCIRFDSNPCLNYLSLPVLYQLMCQIPHALNQESGNVIPCRSLRLSSKTNYFNFKTKILLSPESDNKLQSFVIEIPRPLIVIHNVHENKAVSLWELSLRKVYLCRFHHTLDISWNPPRVNVKQYPILDKTNFEFDNYLKALIPYSLLINGPISICTNNCCNEPIFTEAWILLGIGKNTFIIPTIVILCSHKCATEFIKTSNFLENYDIYRIHN